jgi:hypothetical protein
VGPANDPSRLTATGSVRSRYWDEAFQMWSTEKATGLGAGGYATARPQYRQDLLEVRHAHGYVPETMAELGLLGMLVSLALLAAWLVAVRRTVLGVRTGGARGAAEFAGLVTLLAIAVTFGAHSMIDWTWAVPGVALVGLVAAGWVAGRGPGPARPFALRIAGREPLRIAAAAAVVIVALAACWSALLPKLASDAADDALGAMRAGDLDRARELVDTAERRNPLSIEPLLDRAAIEARAGRKDRAEAALEEAVRLQPANWLPWMRLTDYRLFELNQPKRAMEAIRVAIFLNPRSWDVAQRYLDVRRRLKRT